jgi:hypothetical protein
MRKEEFEPHIPLSYSFFFFIAGNVHVRFLLVKGGGGKGPKLYNSKTA